MSKFKHNWNMYMLWYNPHKLVDTDSWNIRSLVSLYFFNVFFTVYSIEFGVYMCMFMNFLSVIKRDWGSEWLGKAVNHNRTQNENDDNKWLRLKSEVSISHRLSDPLRIYLSPHEATIRRHYWPIFTCDSCWCSQKTENFTIFCGEGLKWIWVLMWVIKLTPWEPGGPSK